MIEAHSVHARAITKGEPPADIQFMPPGEQTITCSVGGQAKTITTNVTAQTAAKLQSDLRVKLAAAQSNQGDRPFLDFNHEDAEAAAYVTELYWAGDDPLTGGVRARVEWTSAGDAALRGGVYRRYSPNFLVDAAGNIVGLGNENLGGLVNRAAFRTIQPVMAKSAALSEIARTAGVGEDEPFFLRVEEAMEQEGLNEKLAWAYVLKNEPDLWLQHVYKMMEIDPEQANRLGIKSAIEATAQAITPETYVSGIGLLKSMMDGGWNTRGEGIENHPLCVQARSLAQREGISFVEATTRIVTKNPELYADYRKAQARALPEKPKPAKVVVNKNDPEQHPLMVKARELADQKDLSLAAAIERVVAKEPQLYDDYRHSLGHR